MASCSGDDGGSVSGVEKISPRALLNLGVWKTGLWNAGVNAGVPIAGLLGVAKSEGRAGVANSGGAFVGEFWKAACAPVEGRLENGVQIMKSKLYRKTHTFPCPFLNSSLERSG